MSAAVATGRALQLRGCHVCGAVSHERQGPCCPRCRAPVSGHLAGSIGRCWALLLAAAVLYLPANLLPIMRTHTLFATRQDTIFSGVAELWRNGAWDLALIVFVASVLVPLVKILSLAFLLVTVQRGSAHHAVARTRLYRLLEFVGHWSMLDVFVVGLLGALVQFDIFAQVTPEPGARYFGAVVVLTMLASRSFDPRLIWQGVAATATTPGDTA